MRKIGLDFGTTSCGIAISDSSNLIANGICNFKYKNNNTMLIVKKLQTILLSYNYQIDTFIIGYPTYNISGEKTKTAILIDKFIELLNSNFKEIKVIKWDENYSTKKASTYLYEFNIKSSHRKKIIDMVSASFILQSYLDSCNKK